MIQLFGVRRTQVNPLARQRDSNRSVIEIEVQSRSTQALGKYAGIPFASDFDHGISTARILPSSFSPWP
jgi:hypothetical protein